MTPTISAAAALLEIPVGELYPDPRQPRKVFDEAALAELAASIAVHGVLEPLIVARQVRHDNKPGYTVVAGERRWRAAQKAGRATVPAIVRELSPAAVAEIQLVENLQREDLGALELAAAYARYLEATKRTQAELAKAIGKTEGYVSHALGLLKLPAAAQRLIAGGQLTAMHGRELLRLEAHPDKLAEVVKRLAGNAKYQVPTTRDLAQQVGWALDDIKREQELAAERAKQAKQAAADKAAGKKAPANAAKSSWELQQARWSRERAERTKLAAQVKLLLPKRSPAIAARIRPLVDQVAKIPAALLQRLDRVVDPTFGDEELYTYVGKDLGVKKSGHAGASARIAFALWDQANSAATRKQLEKEAAAALKSAAKKTGAAGAEGQGEVNDVTHSKEGQ